MFIAAGKLSKKIAIYRRVVSSDKKGFSAVSYEKYKEVWSEWRQITSRELMRNQIEFSLDIFTVRIRLDMNIHNSDQVRYKSRAYNITSVVHDETAQSTILTLEAGVTIADEAESGGGSNG